MVAPSSPTSFSPVEEDEAEEARVLAQTDLVAQSVEQTELREQGSQNFIAGVRQDLSTATARVTNMAWVQYADQILRSYGLPAPGSSSRSSRGRAPRDPGDQRMGTRRVRTALGEPSLSASAREYIQGLIDEVEGTPTRGTPIDADRVEEERGYALQRLLGNVPRVFYR